MLRAPSERFLTLEALVDTGSTYSWIPRDVLDRLGIVPEQEWPFELADGRKVRYPVGWMQIRLELRGRMREQPTLVVFAPPGSEPILGVVTLEEYLLAADGVVRVLGSRFYPTISSTPIVTFLTCSGVTTSPRATVPALAYCPATGSRYTWIRFAATSTIQASGMPARA